MSIWQWVGTAVAKLALPAATVALMAWGIYLTLVSS